MGDWREREAHNEARFCEQNVWVEVTGASFGASEPLIVFVCECGDANCTLPIELTIGEYESVRGVSNRLAVAPYHENPESEVIVSENARFTIVDKITAPGLRIARETDPRAEPLPHAPLPDAPFSDDMPSAAATVTYQAADRRWMEECARLFVETASRYRLVDERIRAVGSGDDSHHEDGAEQIVVFCECGHTGCTETLSVPLSMYVWTWVAPARFVIVAGHELPDFQRVVGAGEGYAIVERRARRVERRRRRAARARIALADEHHIGPDAAPEALDGTRAGALSTIAPPS
jgi:hypothetical protein